MENKYYQQFSFSQIHQIQLDLEMRLVWFVSLHFAFKAKIVLK